MVTCDQQEKILSNQNVLAWIFLQIRNKFWRHFELNCLLVGSGKILLNIELQQGDRTVCCGHKTVQKTDIQNCTVKLISLQWSAEQYCGLWNNS